MDPALLNYLQNSQASQMSGVQQPQPQPTQQLPMQKPMQQPMLQQQPAQQAPTQQQQAPYNPFDSGVQKAIASARMSLGMNKEQQEGAFNNSLLAFGDSMAQMPREKGFMNNLASFGRALSPALKTYDQSENAAMAENQNMANQILQYQAAEQARQAQQEERAWHRKHAENQLGEQRRYHDLMDSRMSDGTAQHNKTRKEERSDSANGQISNVLKNAEDLLTEDLEKQETWRGRLSNLFSRFTPGGYIPTEKQAEVNALGDVLRGNLFNVWGYRNRAEFEHVPSISADNPPEVNLKIIGTLKKLIGDVKNEQFQDQQNLDQGGLPQSSGLSATGGSMIPASPDEQSNQMPLYVMLYDPDTGEGKPVHRDSVAQGLKQGLVDKR